MKTIRPVILPIIISFSVLMTFLTFPIQAQEFNLKNFKSPILSVFPEDRTKTKYESCFRDPAVWFENGSFYLFFTLIEMENGHPYSFVGMTVSKDLIHFEPIKKLTPKDLAKNFGSPGNVVRFNGEYVLCCQTYCQENGEKYGNANSRIFIMRSKDLRNWSSPELLYVKGIGVPVEKMGRMIDPYLMESRSDPGLWYCFYKQNGVSISTSRDLKNWQYLKSVRCGENVCIVYDQTVQKYRLWNSPENGMGMMTSDNLLDWQATGEIITLGQKNWPWAQGRITAGVVADLRNVPEIKKALLFFHASEKPEKEIFPQGTSLGIAWSDDLIHWNYPVEIKK